MSAPTLPQPPFFLVPNIDNLRDAALYPGGLPTSPTKKVRPGILFRSALPANLDRSGWTTLRSLGIGHVFDLRSMPEVLKGWEGIAGSPDSRIATGGGDVTDVRPGWIRDMEAAGVKRTFTPVFPEADYSPERLAERYMKYMDESDDGFVKGYHDILLHAGPAFSTILKYLASLDPQEQEEEGEPRGALIHCTAGKDRTGIFFGILLSFLGVEKQRIADEYQLTELGLAHIREDVVRRLTNTPGFQKYCRSLMDGKEVDAEVIAKGIKTGDDGSSTSGEEQDVPPEVLEKGRQAALRMIGARKVSMLGTLDMVEREWGSAEGYLRKVPGLNDEELEALKRNLIVDA